MHVRTTAFIMSALVFVSGSVTHAGLLDPVSIERRCYVNIDKRPTFFFEDTRYTHGVEPFSESVSIGEEHAVQNSTITSDTISFSAAVSAYASNVSSAYASSYLRETFLLDSGSPFSFSYTWSDLMHDFSSASLSISLTGPSGTVFSRNSQEYNGTWSLSGNLDAGQYTYIVHASASAPGCVNYAGVHVDSATFSLLPEPASAAMFGLAALVAMRRTKSRRVGR